MTFVPTLRKNVTGLSANIAITKGTLFKATVLGVGFTLLMNAPLMAQTADLGTSEGKAGYAIGVSIGTNLVDQGVTEDVSTDSLIAGLKDAIGGELKMTDEQMSAAMQEFSMLQQSKAQAAMEATVQEGQAYLASNGQKSGVTTTASGLQYEVISTLGDNAAKPAVTDTVNVHYHGTLLDGTVFDSSVDRGEPISFPLNGVIPGWTEGVQLMQVGDKFRFVIPSELAYGAQGAGGAIGPNATLVFEVELLGIE